VSRTGRSVAGDLREPRIERHRADPDRGIRLTARAAQQRAQAGQHFFHPEWFRDVVVCAAVDPLYLLVPAPSSREHQHGRRQTGVAPAPQQRQAVHPRQPQVEEDRVVGLGVGEEVGPVAASGVVDGIARGHERRGELPGKRRLVLDDENAHMIRTVIAHHALNAA
jgi:hypothetical protein